MNLFKFKHREDFGYEWYFQILNVGRRSLLQFSVSWCEYPSWPYIQISSGNGCGLSVLFWAYKFGLDIDLLSRTWRWDHLEEVDEKETDYLGMDEC
jgi:hypothetical protein